MTLGVSLLVALGMILVLILVAGRVEVGAAPESGHGIAPILYGSGSLLPLVAPTPGGVLLDLYGPGGTWIARVAQSGSGEPTVTLPVADRLGSSRWWRSAGGDLGIHCEYGPYGGGDRDQCLYAGHPYDPHQDVYQTPSRVYDPTVGRFASTDPQHAGANPYAYANLNPTNEVDPDGRAPIHFLLYSKYGIMIPDDTGRRGLWGNISGLMDLSREIPMPVVSTTLEKNSPVMLPAGEFTDVHLTIFAHGLPGQIYMVDPHTDELMPLSGSEFPRFLRLRMQRRFGDYAREIAHNTRSISFLNCHSGCRTSSDPGPSGNSFGEEFARNARLYFPRLDHVVASPYEIGNTGSSDGMRPDRVAEFSVFLRGNDPGQLAHYIAPDRFFSGDYPSELFGPADRVPFGIVNGSLPTPGMPSWMLSRRVSNDPLDIEHYLRINADRLSEPVLRRIPVPVPPVVPPAVPPAVVPLGE